MRLKFFMIIIGVLVFVGVAMFFLGPVLFASIAYPLEKSDATEIDKWTKQYCTGIANPNALVAGLIMTESGWRTSAKSSAGAIGLTQFMPATAVGVAKRLGVSPFTPTDLNRDRNLAIRFGSYYICTRIKDYGGDVTKGLVAYNGGGGAVTAYEQGYPVRGTVGYATTVQNRAKGYASVYGANLEKAVTGDSSTTSSTPAFSIQPKIDLTSLATMPIFDFWRGWLSTSPKSSTTTENSGGLEDLWQNLLPGQ